MIGIENLRKVRTNTDAFVEMRGIIADDTFWADEVEAVLMQRNRGFLKFDRKLLARCFCCA